MAKSTQTNSARRARTVKRLTVFFIVLLLVVGSMFAYRTITTNLREQGEVSVRNAVLNSAKQCCAIEGSYPTSLYYLEQNYGLVINRDDYVVNYEVFASNVMPSVVVLAR